MQNMPKDPVQRRRYVRDRRRKITAERKAHKEKVEASEFQEIDENVDRAWSERGHTVGKPLFAGFGAGQPGSAGRWIHRGGKLVRA